MSTRRDFLRGAVATSAVVMAARSRLAARALNADRHFARVKVSRDRVIREVVGLRPYRSEGFVIDAERTVEKLLVHNYGHGGAGITLSWGTAALALDIARDYISARTARNIPLRFAVLGCGVNGLSTARLLQRHFDGPVTIYAKDLPPETTSNVAGGFWSPTSVSNPGETTLRFRRQFREACRISNRAFQLLAGTEYGVRWMETFELIRNEASLSGELPGGNDLYPVVEIHREPEKYFGFPFVRQFNTMLIEPSIYLTALLRDFYVAGGKVMHKTFRNREEIRRLPEQIIFNCTGLGSRDLFGDSKLIPVRGQLEVLLPQPEIDYCYLGEGYMFPRRDGIVLGGTFDHGDWSLQPKPEQTSSILDWHTEMMKNLKL